MTFPVGRSWIPGGDGGTLATVSAMRRLIRQGSTQPIVREVSSRIMAGVGGRDVRGQAAALRRWMSMNFRFLRDPLGDELLHAPDLLLRNWQRLGYIQGDCDDAAVLAGALARSVGMPVRLVVVAFKSLGPFAHVWAEVSDPTESWWQEMDVTRSRPDLMSHVKRIKRVKV